MDQSFVILLERTEQMPAGSVVTAPYSQRSHWSGTSSGWAIAAFSPASVRQELLRAEAANKDNGVSLKDLEARLEQVRHQGYAEREVENRRYTLCAPVLDQSGYAAAGIACSVPSIGAGGREPSEKEHLIDFLREAAARCSAHMGHVLTIAVP
jgi:DNA-binding IclR family transcriptional regulator